MKRKFRDLRDAINAGKRIMLPLAEVPSIYDQVKSAEESALRFLLMKRTVARPVIVP